MKKSVVYLTGACGLVASGAANAASAPASAAPQRYNILYIMADDHGTGAISAYHRGSMVRTPNIDRLAARGMLFNDCMSVVSLSAPSRASIITGKYNELNGLWRNETLFDGSQQTLPKLMQQAGYQTAIFGKWHLGSEPTGFDYYEVLPGQGRYFDCPLLEKGKPWTGNKGGVIHKGFITDVITDESIKWLEGRDPSKPFMLMVHHKAPHGPYEYPDKYRSVLADVDIPEPANFWDDLQGRNSNLREDSCVFTKLLNIDPLHFVEPIPAGLKQGMPEYKEWAYQAIFKGYYRLVTSLDENIGRLMNYLQKTGLDKNTIIIYTADNGFFMGDHGFFNKMWMYEESLRVPLIVDYPGMKKGGRVSDLLVSTLDYAPTILDCVGAPIPADLQGRSLLPVLEGRKPADWRKEHYYHYVSQYEVPEHYGLRTDRYKLIYFPESKDIKWELYDLKKDPKEMHNVASEPKYGKLVADLSRRMHDDRLRFEHIDDPRMSPAK